VAAVSDRFQQQPQHTGTPPKQSVQEQPVWQHSARQAQQA